MALRFGSTDAAAAENCAEKLDLGEGPWPDMYLTRDCSEIEIGPLDYLQALFNGFVAAIRHYLP